MQYRHMRGRHFGPFHMLVKLMVIFLIFGGLFSLSSHHNRSSYWDGYRDGALSTQSGQSAASGVSTPDGLPYGPQNWSGPHRSGPGFGAFFLVPLCGLALVGFMGFLFTIGLAAARRGRSGPGDPGGRGPCRRRPSDKDFASTARQVDDDEIGPEKDPNDFL